MSTSIILSSLTVAVAATTDVTLAPNPIRGADDSVVDATIVLVPNPTLPSDLLTV